ncbi:MAG: hypothetical protein Q9160_009227 [Pyrenula sp. 1 TL-2023]
MSGLEVVGVILGAIPILVEGLKVYRSGLKTVGRGFRKRKTIEKLSRALLLQQGTLEELLKQVLIKSGHELPADFAFGVNALSILSDTSVQDNIVDYLGTNFDAFMDTIKECYAIFQKLVTKTATMVPSVKGSKDISMIIEANKKSSKGEFDLMSRVSLVLRSKDLDEDCRELDQKISSLDRFLRLLSSNHRPSSDQPSRKAKRLAKAFWKDRKHAVSLYTAVSKSWISDCHRQHEARLLLEDRLNECVQLHAKHHDKDLPSHVFQIVFLGDISEHNYMWHESMVQVYETSDVLPDDNTSKESDNNPRKSSIPTNTNNSKVKFSLPTPPLNAGKNKEIEVKDICSTIRAGKRDQEHVMFSLTIHCQIAKAPSIALVSRPMEVKETVFLKDLLCDTSNTRGAKTLSWAPKILLALNVATSFLQLLRTPWSLPRLSTETISFLQSSNSNPDVGKPLLSQHFNQSSLSQHLPDTGPQRHEAVLEVGIMLLEIWDQTPLEQKFSLAFKPSYNQKQALAMEWYDEAQGSLPVNYLKAVFHCIAGVKNVDCGQLEWDNMKLWEAFCECVIEPLSKISKI